MIKVISRMVVDSNFLTIDFSTDLTFEEFIEVINKKAEMVSQNVFSYSVKFSEARLTGNLNKGKNETSSEYLSRITGRRLNYNSSNTSSYDIQHPIKMELPDGGIEEGVIRISDHKVDPATWAKNSKYNYGISIVVGEVTRKYKNLKDEGKRVIRVWEYVFDKKSSDKLRSLMWIASKVLDLEGMGEKPTPIWNKVYEFGVKPNLIKNEGKRMSKTVIISEEAMDRLGLRLNPVLYKMLKNGDTSLGRNPALPDDPLEFQYEALKDGMSVAVDEMKQLGADMSDIHSVIDELRHMIREAISLESNHKSVLEKLCYNCITELFSVPDGTINLSCKLGNPRDGGKVQVRLIPEEDKDYVFSDVDDSVLMQSEVAKRRMIDCLVMGGSYALSKYIEEYWKSEISELDERLCELYNRIDVYDRYLLYADNPVLSDDEPMLNAYVAVRLGGDVKRTDIEATGIIFPYLLRETIRGFMELFSSHGLPSNNERAMEIVRRSDFMVAEPWDMRLGIVLWKKFWNLDDFGSRTIPYYFKEVCSLDVEDFNNFMREQMLKTKKSKRLMFDIISSIYKERERDKFLGRMKKKNLDNSLIDDGDMSIDDLDSFEPKVITEYVDDMEKKNG